MDGESPRELRPPEDLRPAQLGIVLVGRVILGHISATLVDLAQRGFLGLEETRDGDDGDWLLTDRRGAAGSAGRLALLGFERTLLDGVFDGKSLVRLSELGESLVPSLNHMRAQIRRDAVRRGRLRRFGRDKRTPGGEQLLHQIRDFRRDLRTLASGGDAAAGLAGYAMIFGLAHAASPALPAGDAARTGGRNPEGEIAWAKGDRLTQGWMAVCGTIPAVTHAWSELPGHDAGHLHGSAHGESHGGYGGHGGHFDGGGHGGH
jgi:hypothetical protein